MKLKVYQALQLLTDKDLGYIIIAMKIFTILVVFTLSGLSIAQTPTPIGVRRTCPRPPEPATPRSMEELRPILEANKIEILENNTVTPINVENFLSNYNMMPENFRREMIQGGAKIRLMEGTGVGIDPSLTATTTVEGTREWINVPGAGGSIRANVPTRIAVNHLYDKHGSLNLVLHEHAHTLDSLYGDHALSSSPTWTNLIASAPRATEFLNVLCANQYCTPEKPIEAFAELFTYYYACESSRSHMEEIVPEIAEFFSRFNSAQDMLAGRIPVRTTAIESAAAPSGKTEECDTSPTADITKSVSDFVAVKTKLEQTFPHPNLRSGSTDVSASGMK